MELKDILNKSRVNTHVLMVDIDGTIVDSVNAWIEHEGLEKRVIKTYDLDEIYGPGSNERFNKFLETADLPLMDGVLKFLDDMSKRYSIYIVSSRNKKQRDVFEKTYGVEVLDKNPGLKCDVLIDDYPINGPKRGLLIIFDRPWNRYIKGYVRITGWQ